MNINHGSFTSLCIGENHGTVLEFMLMFVTDMHSLHISFLECVFYVHTNYVYSECYICRNMDIIFF